MGDYTPAVGNIDFMEKNLYEAMDLNNVELCSALCRLIVRGVPYQNKWANLLIKVANIIDGHR